jgi:hypothetical protein
METDWKQEFILYHRVANPHVAVIIDHYAEDWIQLAWVQVRGKAEIV